MAMMASEDRPPADAAPSSGSEDEVGEEGGREPLLLLILLELWSLQKAAYACD